MRLAAKAKAAHGKSTEDTGKAAAASRAASDSAPPESAPVVTVQAAVRVRPLVEAKRNSEESGSGCLAQHPTEVIRVVTTAGRLTRPLASAYTLEVVQPSSVSRGPYELGSKKRGPSSSSSAPSPPTAKAYAFDYCAGPSTTQEELFHRLEMPAQCEAALAGQVVTIFCFGQTGSGKTFTLSGRTLAESEVCGPDGPLVSEDGLQYQAAAYMAKRLKELRHAARQTTRKHSAKHRTSHSTEELSSLGGAAGSSSAGPPTVIAKCSYVELYQETLYDLLQSGNEETVRCRWSATAQSFYVEGSLQVECRSKEDFLLVLREGQRNRQRGSHALNRDSSRSHVVFTVFLEIHDGDAGDGPAASAQGHERPPSKSGGCRYGRLVFVDLAGSERLKKSQSSSVAETGSINKSLFTLGRVLELLSTATTTTAAHTAGKEEEEENSASATAPSFIPYRSSILTQLLMQSLDGHGRTLMVACVSPSAEHLDESLRTLHYAQRARHIRTSPVVHVDAATQQRMALEEMVRELRRENAVLRRALQLPSVGPLTEEDVQRQVGQLRRTGAASPSPLYTGAAVAAEVDGVTQPSRLSLPTAGARKRMTPAVTKARTSATPPAKAAAPRIAASHSQDNDASRPSRPSPGSAPPTPAPTPLRSSATAPESVPQLAGASTPSAPEGGGAPVNILALLDALPDIRSTPVV